MSEPLIKLENVSRRFRLRSKSRLHLLALLGLDFGQSHGHDFWAVRDVSFSVPQGSRLGIIGRNGAGKSTLLKIIAGILAPSEGNVSIKGRVETLMQLGAGFHPEFTGRDNVIGSLSYRGVTGKAAQRLADEIIEFAELEQFQHNQLKTYSSGMAARLGFSAATAIVPEVLIIDEILGAGDAYFASKSFDRMRRLTSGGTTVLFVSHDMSSVEQLCDEAIWMERGRLRDSGTTQRLSRAYAKEVREQERQRLKALNTSLSVENFRKLRSRHDRPLQFITRVQAEGKTVHGHSCTLLANGETFAEVRIGDSQDNALSEVAAIVLDRTASRWGSPRKAAGLPTRSLPATAGSCGMCFFNLAMMEPDVRWSVRWQLSGGPARIEVFDGTAYRQLIDHPGGPPSAITADIPKRVVEQFLISEGFDLAPAEGGEAEDAHAPKRRSQSGDEILPDLATGEIDITRVAFEGPNGVSTHLLKSFETLNVRIGYRANRELMDAVFVVCFYRDGICALQSLSVGQDEDPPRLAAGDAGELTLSLPSLPLGRGLYLVSIAVFPRSVFTERDGDHNAYALLDRQFQIRVEQPEGGLIDLGIARGTCLWQRGIQEAALGEPQAHSEDRPE